MEVVARTPTRIDLAGGTLDIPPLDLLVPGASTLNVAIDLTAVARAESIESGVEVHAVDRDIHLQFDDPGDLEADRQAPLLTGLLQHFTPSGGIRLTTDCGSPAGAGLGGSSSLAVAVAGALSRFVGARPGPDHLLNVARDVETRVLGVPTGVQDYLAALHGGALSINFGIGGRQVEPVSADLDELRLRTVVVYTGEPRESGINNWKVTRSFLDGDAVVREHLEEIARQVPLARRALQEGDFDALARAMAAEWSERRKLAPGVSTPTIVRLFEAAVDAGAQGAKVCGAGGGGCAVLMVPPERRLAVEAAARQAGARVLDFSFARSGLSVTAST